MNPGQVTADEALRRREFPVCAQTVFLGHAGVSPLPARVAAAMQRYVEAATRGDQEAALAADAVSETRKAAARLLEARAEEIAFVGSTSIGLSMVATGWPWRPGENLVCYGEDFPANVYPWIDLRSRGVEVRLVEARQYGKVTVEDLARVVDQRTRMVALASAHFVAGWRLPVEEIGRFLRERGVLFCLDGIQSFGALRTSVNWVDFAAADAHKWLLGPQGAGILYVRQEHFERLHPPLLGWHNAVCPDFIAQSELAFLPDARRYEPGSWNLAGIVGMGAGLHLLLECGLEAIEARVLELARRVIRRALDQGFAVIGPVEGDGLSGIVSFTAPGLDLAALHARLMKDRIVTSLRRRRNGTNCLRVSAHFYNTEGEIDRLMDAVGESTRR